MRTSRLTASGHIDGYAPENVVSGVTRTIGDNSHLWQSNDMSEENAFLSLDFKEEKKISEVRVTFDPDLNIEIMISQTKRRLDGMIKGMPPSLVKDFTVSLFNKDQKVYTKKIADNNERLCVIKTQTPVIADKVLIEIESTYGDKTAKIFEVRIY